MSETTSTPQPEDLQGTFVGGTFGGPTQPTEPEGVAAFRAVDVGELGDVEGVESGDAAAGDVETVTEAVPPGERNEPV